MTAVASGANSRLIRCRETIYGVSPGDAGWTQAPFYAPLDFGGDQALTENPVIGLANTRDEGDAIHDAVTVGATLEVPLDKVEIGHWLSLVLGAPVTAGATADKTHTFKSGGAELPSEALELGFPDIGQYWLMLGAQAGTLEINAQPTGRPTCKIGIMGKSSTRGTASEAVAPAAPASFEQFMSFGGTLKRNGAAVGRVTSLAFTYTNSLEGNRSVGSGEDIEDLTAGAGVLTGSLGVRLADGVLFGDAETKTPLALELGFTLSPTKSLVFTLPRVFLPRKRAQVQGKAGVQATFDLRGGYDATAGCALSAVLKNQLAAY